MVFSLIRELDKKEEKTELEWTLLKYYRTFAIISEILVSESKLETSSSDAILQIRNCMNENL